MTAGRFAVPYYDWGTPAENELGTYIRAVDNAGLFFNKKYNPMASEAGAINDCPLASDKNLHVIRYAEVLLMAVECAIHEGDYTTALGSSTRSVHVLQTAIGGLRTMQILTPVLLTARL